MMMMITIIVHMMIMIVKHSDNDGNDCDNNDSICNNVSEDNDADKDVSTCNDGNDFNNNNSNDYGNN